MKGEIGRMIWQMKVVVMLPDELHVSSADLEFQNFPSRKSGSGRMEGFAFVSDDLFE